MNFIAENAPLYRPDILGFLFLVFVRKRGDRITVRYASAAFIQIAIRRAETPRLTRLPRDRTSLIGCQALVTSIGCSPPEKIPYKSVNPWS